MEYEWDQRKNAANVEKHGISFEDAIDIFSGGVVQKPDRRREYGEERFIAYGVAQGEVLTVVYTIRHGRRRIISARRASRGERRAYRTTHPGDQAGG